MRLPSCRGLYWVELTFEIPPKVPCAERSMGPPPCCTAGTALDSCPSKAAVSGSEKRCGGRSRLLGQRPHEGSRQGQARQKELNPMKSLLMPVRHSGCLGL